MPDPLTPFVVNVTGTANSVVGDSVRVTVYSGSTARGSVTGVLDSSKEFIADFANSDITVSIGDTLVVTENGSALGGNSHTVQTGNTEMTISPTAVAFPSRSL